ncbi:Transmembrane glycoprotein NMB [Fukomys damarensis]|uniref:Transmembrane glycoprotein NMB n=1 Tax=Fukomys damarensis TaxID=885580 RepID=A0A091ERX2_FUKDA|nr:Transmembrane glycoprotein NMB [Fukomys damarensis]
MKEETCHEPGKHKEYKPIKSSTEKVVKSKGLQVILNYTKAVFFPGNQEKNPLLKDHARIL